MSQGIIIRKNGPEKPSTMDVLRECILCSCGKEEFLIYHHRAHPEDVDKQKNWLTAELEGEHKLHKKHKDAYRFPL